MKIYDISQEVFGCKVFPGDPSPQKTVMMRIEDGDICNLSALNMCAHNGTHVDSPFHFYNDGKRIDEMDLDKMVGLCYVYTKDGELSAEEARNVIQKAKEADSECAKRLLFRGQTVVTEEAANVFAESGVCLVGNESQTVGPEEAPKNVHLILLEKEVVLLEGIRLAHVAEGKYLLSAAPLNLGGADGSPCRAVLIEE